MVLPLMMRLAKGIEMEEFTIAAVLNSKLKVKEDRGVTKKVHSIFKLKYFDAVTQ